MRQNYSISSKKVTNHIGKLNRVINKYFKRGGGGCEKFKEILALRIAVDDDSWLFLKNQKSMIN